MKSVEFCYWLQGFFELSGQVALNENQAEMIKKHLALVFHHEIDPSYPKDQQAKLNQIHGSTVKGSAYLPGQEPGTLIRC